MDKQEYRIRAEEIKTLIARRDFFGAVKIADEIDWTRVRSVAMLCTVSDLYKANRRYKESKELLLMAYERHPNGRMILYSLCELCIKMGEVVQAIEYYKEFVQLAPMDNGKFVLQYKLYVAQDVSLEERIAVLEELKRRDYREKWGYELAYLYHRIGLATKCVEECDELILWFSDGRYVKKAMELKMLHQPLTMAQEESYNAFVGKNAELPKPKPVEEKPIEDQIKEPSVNVGQYDTINLQKALAESMKEVLSPVVSELVPVTEETSVGGVTSQMLAALFQNTSDMKEVYFEDNTGEIISFPGQKKESVVTEEPEENTVREAEVEIQESKIEEAEVEVQESKIEEAAAEVQEVKIEAAAVPQETVTEEPKITEKMDAVEDSVTTAEETIEKETEAETVVPAMAEAKVVKEEETASASAKTFTEPKKIEVSFSGVPYEVPMDATKEIPSIREIMGRSLVQVTDNVVMDTSMKYTEAEIPPAMAELLSQEYDGQIGLVVEEKSQIEKQITGQMNIDEVLEEWEKTKKEYEEKRKAERTRKVLEQTGSMFTEFDQKVRDGILEQLQEKELPEQENVTEESVVQEKAAEAKEEAEETIRKIQQAQEEIRELSDEEKVLFAPFIQTKGAKRRFIKALDKISLAAYTGNVIVTGEADSDTVKLAKNVMKDIQMTEPDFSGVIAKVSGASLNSKSVEGTITKLNNGGLIIEKASEMNSQAVMKLLKALDQEKTGIVVILEDNKKAMGRMMAAYPSMNTFFNAHIEVEELNSDALTEYGRQYAMHLEYSIDELGMLALQTLIEERQTSEHIVTVAEVRELIDRAVTCANRKTMGHFFDVIMGKRYDEEDMIILREKDFY